MGLGNWTPGRVRNRSSQSLACLVSRPVDGSDSEEWVYFELKPGFESHWRIDVDAVKHFYAGDPAIEFGGKANKHDQWWAMRGGFPLIEVHDPSSGLATRWITVTNGFRTKMELWDESILDGLHFGNAWPADRQPSRI